MDSIVNIQLDQMVAFAGLGIATFATIAYYFGLLALGINQKIDKWLRYIAGAIYTSLFIGLPIALMYSIFVEKKLLTNVSLLGLVSLLICLVILVVCLFIQNGKNQNTTKASNKTFEALLIIVINFGAILGFAPLLVFEQPIWIVFFWGVGSFIVFSQGAIKFGSLLKMTA